MKKILKTIFLCVSLPVFSLSAENLTQYVNPMIGTDGYGNVYPGAQIPFGGIQISPDTDAKFYVIGLFWSDTRTNYRLMVVSA